MSVDADTVRRIAHLARIAVAENEVEHLKGELNTMLAFVEQLAEAKRIARTGKGRACDGAVCVRTWRRAGRERTPAAIGG